MRLFFPRHLLLLPGLLSCVSTQGRSPLGPLPARVEHPLAISLLSMRPRRAIVKAPAELGLSIESAYMSIHEVQSDETHRVAFDGETWHNSMRLRAGLGGATDLEVEIGILSGRSGFLDRFAEAWHDFTGLPDGGRSRAANDLYRMRISRGAQEDIYELDKGVTSVTDVPVLLTRQLFRDDEAGYAGAVRVGIELPIGDSDKGFGNSELDWGLGMLAERHLARASLYGGLDWIRTGQGEGFDRADVEILDQLHVQFGVEWPTGENSAVLTQLEWVSPMIDDIDLEEVDREILDLGVGYAWRRRGLIWRLSFHEDLVAASGPDFSFFLNLSYGF